MTVTLDLLRELPGWPRFLGEPIAHGRLKAQPEDFRVDEIPQVLPGGEGSHLWLHIEKRGANTDWVAGQLASRASCSARDVGFAGMKDRHAVTTQWFSLPGANVSPGEWRNWDIEGVRILDASLHTKKLKRGVLKGNRFRLAVRELAGDTSDLEQRLEQIKSRGLPNYFGPQRFGHGGNNVWRAARWLRDGGRLNRSKRSLYLSAVRSFLFNEVLAERVRLQNWDQLLDGDVVALDGSHSVFVARLPDAELEQRCKVFDLHPTGPLPGDAPFAAEREAAELEARILEPHAGLIDGLRKARVDASRRSLRLCPFEMEWELQGNRLSIGFSLPPGAYATTVIGELVCDLN